MNNFKKIEYLKKQQFYIMIWIFTFCVYFAFAFLFDLLFGNIDQAIMDAVFYMLWSIIFLAGFYLYKQE